MILKIHLTDNDLRAFFDRAGYVTKTEALISYQSVSHGRLREVETDTLMVVTPSRLYRADELYEKLMRAMAVNPDQRTVTELDKLIENENSI